MKQNVIQIRKLFHRGQLVWMMSFPYNKSLIGEMKKLRAKYSRTYTSWYLPCSDYSPEKVRRMMGAFAKAEFLDEANQPSSTDRTPEKNLTKEQEKSIIRFQTTIQAKGYSASTLKSYTNLVIKFLKTRNSAQFTHKDIEHYLVHHLQKKNYSNSTQRQFVSALKLYCEMLGMNEPEVSNLTYPKKKNHCPKCSQPRKSKPCWVKLPTSSIRP